MAKEIDDATKAALLEYGVTEEKLAELEEKQKSLPPEEPNVVTKEEEVQVDEPTTENAVLKFFENMVAKARGKAPEPEVAEPTVTETPVAETEVSEKAETEEKAEDSAQKIAEQLAVEVGKTIQPLLEQVKALGEWRVEVEKTLQAREKAVEEKAAELLAQQPPIVKTRVSELNQTVVPADVNKTDAQKTKTAQKGFMDGVKGIVHKGMGGNDQFKL